VGKAARKPKKHDIQAKHISAASLERLCKHSHGHYEQFVVRTEVWRRNTPWFSEHSLVGCRECVAAEVEAIPVLAALAGRPNEADDPAVTMVGVHWCSLRAWKKGKVGWQVLFWQRPRPKV
jgi:hypothetical protein